MIMLGGNMERHEPQALLEVDDELLNKGWPCIKRSPGGHMIATYLREQGYDVEVIDFDELGMEAVRKIKVENFPAFIIVDDKGNDFFEEYQ